MKRLNYFLLIVMMLVVQLSQAQKINLNRGLIAYYPFSGNANDELGYSDGKIHGAELTQERCGDYAYYFDGEDDYIDCGNNTVLNGYFTGLSISTWVKLKFISNGEFGTIVGKWGFDPIKDHFGLWINESYRVVMAVSDDRTMEKGLFSRQMLETERWYHLVAIWKSNRELEVYIDGVLDNKGTQTGRGINPRSEMSLKIGRQVVRRSRAFKGHIDEVRIYNRALNSREVSTLYEMGKAECEKIIIKGHVYNKRTMEPVKADVIFEDLHEGAEFKKVPTEGDESYYETTLPLNYKFGFYAKAPDYISINENIDTERFSIDQVIYKDLYLVPIEIGESLTLNNIFFDFAKSNLRKESFLELNRLIQLFEDFPNLKIEISGHTDSVGSDQANQGLSEDRANAVRDYLLTQHVNSFQVLAKGYGEDIPVSTNDTDEGRQMNRRVEFKILNK
ncbi:MAG: LamG-like jellyroll fold domain-containing protein [Candidatus Cyclobacteriaceae bacterium M3_2C_046]